MMLSDICGDKIVIQSGGQMSTFIDREEWIRIVALGYHLGFNKEGEVNGR